MKKWKNFDMRNIPHERLTTTLARIDAFALLSNAERNWHGILLLLPICLPKARDALAHGNHVTSIQCGDWPQNGSVIISLAAAFKQTYTKGNPYSVTFRRMDDPHYWQADIHSNVHGVEHLIVY